MGTSLHFVFGDSNQPEVSSNATRDHFCRGWRDTCAFLEMRLFAEWLRVWLRQVDVQLLVSRSWISD